MKTRIIWLALFLPLVGFSQIDARARRSSQFNRNEDFFIQQLAVRSVFLSRVQSSESEIAIGQSGINNQIAYTNAGQNNAVRFGQNGNSNVLELELLGDNNDVTLQQNGNRNELRLTGLDVNGVTFSYTQSGNNNSLVQEETLRGRGVSMQVEQFGGMRLIITHGN